MLGHNTIWGDKSSLVYGLQEQGEAYLLTTSRLHRHRCPKKRKNLANLELIMTYLPLTQALQLG